MLAGGNELCLESGIKTPAPTAPGRALIDSVHVSSEKNSGDVCSYERAKDSMWVRRMLTYQSAGTRQLTKSERTCIVTEGAVGDGGFSVGIEQGCECGHSGNVCLLACSRRGYVTTAM